MSDRNRLPDLIHKGITFKVETTRDDDHGAPWEEDDGRGVVTDWLYYPDDPNLRKLGGEQRDGTARYFDVAATYAKALKDGWGIENSKGLTPEQIAAAAVEAEYVFLNEWASDQWEYVGVIVTLPAFGLSASIWGVESNAHEYIQELARELAEEILAGKAEPGSLWDIVRRCYSVIRESDSADEHTEILQELRAIGAGYREEYARG